MPKKPIAKNTKTMDIEPDIEKIIKPKKEEEKNGYYQDLSLPSDYSSFGRIAFTFIGLAIVLLVIIFYFSYSFTTVIITPSPEKISADLDVEVASIKAIQKSRDNTVDDIYKIIQEWSAANPNKLSGQIIEEVIEKEEKFTATGETGNGEPGTAKGMLTVFNQQKEPQSLIEKTRFLSKDGVLFRIRKEVAVPANGKLEVEIFADQPGVAGNIGPSTFTLPGFSSEYKKKMVYGESYKPMTGGIKKTKIITQEDLDKAKTELQEKIYNEALVALENKAQIKEESPASKLPTDEPTQEKNQTEAAEKSPAANLSESFEFSPQAIWQEITESSVNAKAGEQKPEFSIKLKIKVSAILFSQEKLLEVAKNKLKEETAGSKTLTSTTEDSLSYSVISFNSETDLAVLSVHLEGEGVMASAESLDKKELAQLTSKKIKKYLEKHPEIANIEIKESPAWMRQLPILKDHVRIKINQP